jgi:predicted nucleic acid-binding protein
MLDTNVVLDHLLLREPHVKISDELYEFISNDKVIAYITVNCLTDIFYIAKKTLGENATKNALRMLIDISTIVSLDCSDCETALLLPITDFEDAIVVVCANKSLVEYIVTNDDNFPKNKFGSVKTISTADFVKMIRE